MKTELPDSQIHIPVCLVTGAAGGIGQAIVQRLSNGGYRVFAGMRDISGRHRQVGGAISQFAELVELDICDPASVSAALAEVRQRAGRIDILINNAGIGIRGSVEETPLESIRTLFDVNVFGSLRLMQACLPLMRQQGGGLVVQISSICGLVSTPFFSAYEASKHAVECFAESLAYESRDYGIRVSILEPGIVHSGFRSHLEPALGAGRSAYQSLHQRIWAAKQSHKPSISTVEEVAQAVQHIIETPGAPLRTLLGRSAQAIAEKRKQYSDAEYALWLERVLNL